MATSTLDVGRIRGIRAIAFTCRMHPCATFHSNSLLAHRQRRRDTGIWQVPVLSGALFSRSAPNKCDRDSARDRQNGVRAHLIVKRCPGLKVGRIPQVQKRFQQRPSISSGNRRQAVLAEKDEENLTEKDSGHNFDVATAIALAGCAFESYNEPVGVVEGYQEWSIFGTYTTYVDRCAVPLYWTNAQACKISCRTIMAIDVELQGLHERDSGGHA